MEIYLFLVKNSHCYAITNKIETEDSNCVQTGIVF